MGNPILCSILLYFSLYPAYECEDSPCNRTYHADEPESHHDSLLFPSDCLEMVMIGGNSPYFFAISQSLARHLYDHGECLCDEYRTHHDECEECVSHHSDHGECRTECE